MAPRLFTFATIAVSALALLTSSTPVEARRSLSCDECVALVDTSSIPPTDSTETCEFWFKTIKHYSRCARVCSFDVLQPLVDTAKNAVSECESADGGHPDRLPRVECSTCVRNAYVGQFPELAGIIVQDMSFSSNKNKDHDHDDDHDDDDDDAMTKCGMLGHALKRCKKTTCRMSKHVYTHTIEKAQNATENLCEEELENTAMVGDCDRCATEAAKYVATATDEDRCKVISEAVQDLEMCADTDECKSDFHGLVDKLEEAVENDTNGTCPITHMKFDAYQCMRCVRGELNETFLEDGSSDDNCNTAERHIDALQECAETACAEDSRPLEARLEKLQEYLEDKNEAGTCDLDIDDFPFGQCQRCAKPLVDGIDEDDELTCEELGEVAVEIAKCQKKKCHRHRNPLADAVETLREMAGDRCELGEGVDEMCTVCMAELQDDFEAFNPINAEVVCTAVQATTEKAKSCVEICSGVSGTQIILGKVMKSMSEFAREYDVCQDGEEIANEIDAIAAGAGIDLDFTDDEETETESNNNNNMIYIIGGGVAVAGLVGIAVVKAKRARQLPRAEVVGNGSQHSLSVTMPANGWSSMEKRDMAEAMGAAREV